MTADAIIAELRNSKKATYKYLSESQSECCWACCSEHRKNALLGNKATNEEAESTLGGATAQLQKFGRIGLASMAAVSAMKRNGFFHRQGLSKKDKKKKEGVFIEIDSDLRDAIIKMAIEDAPQQRVMNNKALEKMIKVRQEKEKLAKQEAEKNNVNAYIEALYLIQMYDSPAAIKDDPKNVKKVLDNLQTKKQSMMLSRLTLELDGKVLVGIGLIRHGQKTGDSRQLMSWQSICDGSSGRNRGWGSQFQPSRI